MVSPICPHFLQTLGTSWNTWRPFAPGPPWSPHGGCICGWQATSQGEPGAMWFTTKGIDSSQNQWPNMTKFIQNLIKSIFTTNSIPCTSTCISLYSISSSVQNDGLSKLELSLGSANHFWSLNNGSQQPGLIVPPSRQEFMLPFKICQPFSGFEAWPQENGNTSYRCTIDFDGQLLLVQ